MSDKLTKEEMLYEDALELIEKSLQGQTVNNASLTTAIQLLQNAFLSVFLNRMNDAKQGSAFPDRINREDE